MSNTLVCMKLALNLVPNCGVCKEKKTKMCYDHIKQDIRISLRKTEQDIRESLKKKYQNQIKSKKIIKSGKIIYSKYY